MRLLVPFTFAWLAGVLGCGDPPAPTQSSPIRPSSPMRFEVNRGQADLRANFISRGSGYTLFLTDDEAVFSFASRDADVRTSQRRSVLRMRLVASQPPADAVGLDELPGKSNYFRGDDPSRWHSGVPSYAKVKYEGIYPGIDVFYYGNQQRLEYDFVVNPGADPHAIRLAFDAGDADASARVVDGGDLVIAADDNEVRFHAPVVYQTGPDGRHEIDGRFVVLAEDRVGFEVGRYDRNLPLVIDPILGYSTYLGGADDDGAWAIAVDADGNAYVAGSTASLAFPTTEPPNGWDTTHNGGDYDAFLSKISADGSTLVYSTYLGGSGDGSDGDDYAFGVAVDGAGNAYLTGYTQSDFFPCHNEFQTHRYSADNTSTFRGHDIFVSKFSADGSALLYSTYFGGYGNDDGYAIAADDDGNAYITGTGGAGSIGGNYVLRNAFDTTWVDDAIVARFDTTKSGDDSLIYSTLLGGEGFDYGTGIATDGAHHAFVSGHTVGGTDNDFPTKNAFQDTTDSDDAFVVQFDTDAAGADSLVYSSFLGGTDFDNGSGIAVDASGNAYVTGATLSLDFPTTDGAYRRTFHANYVASSFVTKVSAAGALVYSTYLDGNNGEAIAVDSSGNAYVAGAAHSGFVTRYAPQPSWAGGWDGFAAKLSADGSAIVFSTLLGGAGDEYFPVNIHFHPGFGIGVDSAGNAIVAGKTESDDFPTSDALFDTFAGGAADAFVTKLEWHPDFFFSTPTAINAEVGASGTTSIVVNSFDDFSAAVALTSPTPPVGLSPSFGQSSITPAAGSTASSTLTVALGLSVVPGSYTVNVTGASGSLEHSTTATVNVVATTAGTSTVVDGLTALGCIDNSGISGALLAKLARAQAYIDAGDTRSAINTLAALLNELQAQAGKHIHSSCTQNGNTFDPAAVLIAQVQSLLASLGVAALPATPILGYVLSSLGAPVAGATVSIVGSANNAVASATTDITGLFYVPDTGVLTLGAKYTAKPTIPKPYRSSSPTSQSLQWAATPVTLRSFVLK